MNWKGMLALGFVLLSFSAPGSGVSQTLAKRLPGLCREVERELRDSVERREIGRKEAREIIERCRRRYK